MHSADFSNSRKTIFSTFDAGDSSNVTKSRLQCNKLFYEQELTRIAKELDSWEIERKNFMYSMNDQEIYHKYLENLAVCVKSQDSILANYLIRGIIGIGKSGKHSNTQKPVQTSNPIKINLKNKNNRDNQTQTHDQIEDEDVNPNISAEIEYIKGLVARIAKLKSPKIIQKLYDLHESLCKLQTDIPTPTDTPDPQEVTIGTMGQKLSITVKLLQSEIKKNLSKHNIVRLKIDKGVQVSSSSADFFGDTVHEKELEIQNLKRHIRSLEDELKTANDNVSSIRMYSSDTERKHNEAKIELIKTTNKVDVYKENVRNLTQKVNVLAEKNLDKKKKLAESRREVNNMKSTIGSISASLGKNSSDQHGISVMCKIAEEKLEQIQSAWIKNNGKEFQFQRVSSNDICNKYNLYKSSFDPSLTEDLDHQNMSRTHRSRRSSDISYTYSSKASRKQSMQVVKADTFGLLEMSINHQNIHLMKPLIHKGFTLNTVQTDANDPILEHLPPDHIENTVEDLSVISEISSFSVMDVADKQSIEKVPNTDDLAFKQSGNQWGNDRLVSNDSNPDIDRPLNLTSSYRGGSKRMENLRPKQRLSLNIEKEVNEISTPSSSGSPINKTRPLLSTLIIEQDIIHSRGRIEINKIKNIDANSKEVQCNIIQGEPMRKRGNKSGTIAIQHRFIDPDVFDEETMENLRKICEQIDLKIEGELENLPQYLKLELLKAFEGHDKKRCKGECIHLKRALNVRYKAKGVPYPIKRSCIDSELI